VGFRQSPRNRRICTALLPSVASLLPRRDDSYRTDREAIATDGAQQARREPLDIAAQLGLGRRADEVLAAELGEQFAQCTRSQPVEDSTQRQRWLVGIFNEHPLHLIEQRERACTRMPVGDETTLITPWPAKWM